MTHIHVNCMTGTANYIGMRNNYSYNQSTCV